MQGTSRSELAATLDRGARLAEDTATRWVERQGAAVRGDVVSGLLLAAASMDTSSRVVDERDPARETALMITLTLVRDAIDAAERHGLDESLLHCVASLRRVAAAVERELAL